MDELDRTIGELAATQHGVFSRRQVTDAGGTRDQVGWRLRAGRWAVHRPGVLTIVGTASTWEQRLMGCCLASGAPATHRCSAALWQLPRMLRPVPEVSVEHGRRVVLRGAIVHQMSDLDRVDLVHRNGIPTTPLGRAVLDVGAVLDEDAYGLFVRDVVREGRITWSELYEVVVVHGRRGRDGVGRLRSIVEDEHGLVSTGSEFERLVEQLLIAASLPRPVRQHPVHDARGRLVGRIDLAYPAERVAVELDGRRYHSGPEDFERDRTRQNELVLLGWVVLRFTWTQLVRTPWVIPDQVRSVLRSAKPGA